MGKWCRNRVPWRARVRVFSLPSAVLNFCLNGSEVGPRGAPVCQPSKKDHNQPNHNTHAKKTGDSGEGGGARDDGGASDGGGERRPSTSLGASQDGDTRPAEMAISIRGPLRERDSRQGRAGQGNPEQSQDRHLTPRAVVGSRPHSPRTNPRKTPVSARLMPPPNSDAT